jgi:ABC-2 type transport system permease protein
MYKFVMLVKNEIIKLALRGGTKVLFVLLILMSAGICLLFFVSSENQYNWHDSWDPIESYRRELEWVQSDRQHGWEREAERLEFLIENEIRRDDWRHEYVQAIYFGSHWMVNLPSFNLRQTVQAKEFLAENNWQGLYQLIIDTQSRALGRFADNERIEIMNFRFAYALEHDISPGEDSWKNTILNLLGTIKVQIYDLQSRDSNEPDDTVQLNRLKDEQALLEYRVERNISRVVSYGSFMGMYSGAHDFFPGTDVWSMMEACVMMIPFMSVFIIIIAGGMVSKEFSSGTIKFLLINPVKRWKILMSKYAVMLITGLVFLAVMFMIFFVLGGILTGFENINALNLTVNNARVTAIPAFIYFVQLYLLGAVNIGVIATLAFALSSVTRSSALAIAVSIAALIGGTIIDSLLRHLIEVDWGRYLLFANVDLVAIIHGSPMFIPYKGQTLMFSIAVIAVHMLIFLLAAWDGFTKKEI